MNAAEFKKLTPWQQVRSLSGMYIKDEEHMSDRLALICLISRVVIGDADQEFLDSQIDKDFKV